MAKRKVSAATFEFLGEMVSPPPPPAHKASVNATWSPKLTPAQQKVFDSNSRYLLMWSEKGSGKTWAMVTKILKHCYENHNAFGVILTKTQNMSTKGGGWDKLINDVIPEWVSGLGLQVSTVKEDSGHCKYIWILNQYDEWTMISVMSAPHANQLRERFRGVEPSIVGLDELTSCENKEYFTAVSIQLGRRPRVAGVQQYLAACNPEGPSHWVYKKWFEEPFDEETGKWDTDFENVYFPVSENVGNLNAGYLDSLKKIYKNDEVEAARMLHGEWRERASGESLFRELYNETLHVRPILEDGTPDSKNWLRPIQGYPIIIGMDPGSVYNAFIFMQWLPIEEKMKWMIFDEVVLLKRRIKYEDLIPIIMRKVKHWREEGGQNLPQIWISDNSAFNQYRPGQGGFDVTQLEKIYEAMRAKYQLESIKIKQAPKFSGSRAARVQTLQTKLSSDEIVVSSACKFVRSMMLHLESEKQKDGAPFDPDLAMTPRRSDHLHVFDATTYPMLTAALTPHLLQPSTGMEQKLIKVA